MPFVRTAAMLFILAGILGCAVNENTYWTVTDSDAYWNRDGYSIKPPLGNSWTKMPLDDNHPNSLLFVKGEGVKYLGSTMYAIGTAALATSTLLDEPVLNRKDTDLLISALKKHLNRYQMYWTTKITDSGYDNSFGLDCLKYKGTSRIERFKTELGDMRDKEISGYFCLHPQHDNFGVIMESRDFAMVYNDVTSNSEQANHFFTSLRFTPLPDNLARAFKTTTHKIGKAPYQMAQYNKNLWVALRDEDRVVRFDPSTGKIVASVTVGKLPVALCAGEKEIWVANSGDGTVTRIDPDKDRVDRIIPVGGKPVAISCGQGYVWVADVSGNRVIKINPATSTVAAIIDVGQEPVSVAAGNDGIWTANAGDGTVSLIDKAHDRVMDTVRVGGRPVSVSLANTGAWVADKQGKTLARIDRRSRTVKAWIDVGGNPDWVQAFDGWDIFVGLADSAAIVRVDPRLNRVFGSPIKAEAAPRSMVYVAGSIWIANGDGTSLTSVNLDPSGQKVMDVNMP